MATENLSKPYIQLAITEARKAQQERTEIAADRVLREIAVDSPGIHGFGIHAGIHG